MGIIAMVEPRPGRAAGETETRPTGAGSTREVYSHGRAIWLMNSWWLWEHGGDVDKMYLATGRTSTSESAAFEEAVLDFATLDAATTEAPHGQFVRVFYRDTAPLIDLQTGFFILGGKKLDRLERPYSEAAKSAGMAGDESRFKRHLRWGEFEVVARLRGLEIDPEPAATMDRFLSARSRRERGASARMVSLYGAYVEHCTSAGFQARDRRWFEDRLRAAGLKAARVSGQVLRAWEDIRIL